jgi:hypothetical protein
MLYYDSKGKGKKNMKKIVWFVKENGKQVETTPTQIVKMTSSYSAMKITEYDINNETHKVVEFKS